jgi:hypothetical protein
MSDCSPTTDPNVLYTSPFETAATKLKKYGNDLNYYTAQTPDPSTGSIASTLSQRRGAAVALSSLPVTGSLTPTYHIPNPVPQISISASTKRNKQATFGTDYSITLTGHLVPSNSRPTATVGAIFAAQRQLISVLNGWDLYLHVQTAKGNSGIMSFPCVLESVTFDAGQYVKYGTYTINLSSFTVHSGYRNDTLIDQPNTYGSAFSFQDDIFRQYPTGHPHGKLSRTLLEDFTEDWSYEWNTDFGLGTILNPSNPTQYIDSPSISEGYYKVTRTINAVGRDVFNRRRNGSASPRLAWEYAHDAVKNFAAESDGFQNGAMNSGLFPFTFNGSNLTRVGTLNYEAFNFETNTSINKSAGSVQLTQSWILLPSGFIRGSVAAAPNTQATYAFENYSKSASTENEGSYVSVSIEGTIKGLSKVGQLTSSDWYNVQNVSGKLANALASYTNLTKSGTYGYCGLFKRAQAGIEPVLNTQPLSVSVSENPVLGEITYNVTYDNRPTNWFRGVQSENIEIQDTYPGDLYTLVNVIGRPTGPVIQYGAGRTEYRRNVSIDLVLGYHALDLAGGRNRNIVYSKPSINAAFRDDLKTLLEAVSPASEPGIRKYLMDAPQETWNPTTGSYSLQLSWLYELSE